jgi:hypothetical protein
MNQYTVLTFLILFSGFSYAETLSEQLILSLDDTQTAIPTEVWNNIGRPCIYEDDGVKISYLSLFIDMGFGVTPFNEEYNVNRERIFSVIELMSKNGCSINMPHPVTGYLSAHNAVIFYRKNMPLAKFIIENGGDLTAKIPAADQHFPNMNAIEILQTIIDSYPPQKERQKFVEYITSIKTHNQKHQRTP